MHLPKDWCKHDVIINCSGSERCTLRDSYKVLTCILSFYARPVNYQRLTGFGRRQLLRVSICKLSYTCSLLSYVHSSVLSGASDGHMLGGFHG